MELIRRTERRFPNASSNYKKSYGLFMCPYCKKEVERKLEDGQKNKSCGCATGLLISKANTKHSACGSSLHQRWIGINYRCSSSAKGRVAKYYYGRGISVCDEWKHNFIAFRDWAMVNGYKEKLTIDRINNDGNYTPENCRWVTHAVNTRNRRVSFKIDDILKIRKMHKTGNYKFREIASMFKTSTGFISDIVHNKKWNLSK